MNISDDRDVGGAAKPDGPLTIDLGYGVLIDEGKIDRWAEGVRLRHMRNVREIGPGWRLLPDEMRAAWRDLARAAASEACGALALSLRACDPSRRSERFAAEVEQYMTRYLTDPTV